MAALEQTITERYAVYNGDSCEVLADLPDASVDFSIYSPPFADLYNYSSSDRDLSNCATYEEFLAHYDFIVGQVARLTKPGRLTAVHCMDLVKGTDLLDLPGDIVKIHERHGFIYHDRKSIWKEPLRVAMRTRALGLRHSQIVKDSSLCRSALADYVLTFRKKGSNKTPIAHPVGLLNYAGETEVPRELLRYREWKDPKTNKLSHWIWRRYASAIWGDIRAGRVLPYRPARESEEEKHVCPLQLDVIERALMLWSNPGETILTPFAGVGSEVFGAVRLGRRAIGCELKPTYYRQLLKNLAMVDEPDEQIGLGLDDEEEAEESAA